MWTTWQDLQSKNAHACQDCSVGLNQVSMVPDYLVAVESAPRSCNFLTNIFTYVFNYKIATPKKEVFFSKVHAIFYHTFTFHILQLIPDSKINIKTKNRHLTFVKFNQSRLLCSRTFSNQLENT
jgi:hypothetical protein